jgi:hypothetical protein
MVRQILALDGVSTSVRENVMQGLTLFELFIVSRHRERALMRERESAHDVTTCPHKLVYHSLVYQLTQ